jgi:hypothetical protein
VQQRVEKNPSGVISHSTLAPLSALLQPPFNRPSDSWGMNEAAGRWWDDKRRSLAGEARSLPVLALVALLVVWCWSDWRSPPFSPDSWAYYELSQTIWRGGFRLLGLRSYAYPAAAPSGAFPPLWPALWSLVAAASGLGARAGLIASFGCVAVLAVFSEAIGRQLSEIKWVGLAAAAGLFAMPGFADEVDAARSIPLQMALASALIWTLLRRGPIGPARASVMGVICGALVLARFDMLAFSIVFGLSVLLMTRSLGATAAFGLLFVAAASPWVIVSWLSFGELFHSDSSFVASAIDRATFVNDWYPPAHHLLTLRDDPVAWVSKVAGNLPPFLRSAAGSPGPCGLVVLLAAFAALVLRRKEAARLIASVGTADVSVRRFAVIAAAIAAPLLLCVVTGYFDARYFSLGFWYVLMAVLTLAAFAWSLGAGGRRVEFSTMLLALGALALAGAANVPRGLARPPERGFPELQGFARIQMCLSRLGAQANDRVLFEDHTLGARWAAVRRRPAAMLPRNFTRPGLSFAEKGQFLSQQGIRFAVGAPEVLEPIFKPFMQGPALPCGPAVYRLAPGRG